MTATIIEPSLVKTRAEVIRDYRQAKHMTMRQLAQKSAVSLGYLSEIETALKEPSEVILISISRGLGVPSYEILAETARRMEEHSYVTNT